MISSSKEQEAPMQREIAEFQNELHQHGMHAALKYLNSRTPHQYSGVFRFDGATLRNEVLYDRYHPELLKGDDAPMITT